jgi:hypothetical protein
MKTLLLVLCLVLGQAWGYDGVSPFRAPNGNTKITTGDKVVGVVLTGAGAYTLYTLPKPIAKPNMTLKSARGLVKFVSYASIAIGLHELTNGFFGLTKSLRLNNSERRLASDKETQNDRMIITLPPSASQE